MGTVRVARLVGPVALALGIFVASVSAPDTGSSQSSRLNLDLPFDVTFANEDDEAAPEFLVFYGNLYEASSVVLCLDESKSMRKDNRWTLQQREAIRTISEMNEKTELGIVFYGAGSYPFKRSLVPATAANKAAAIQFVSSRKLSLGTCLDKAVIDSLKILGTASTDHRAVIVAGDGRPTTCPFQRGFNRNAAFFQQVIARTISANPGMKMRVHTIYTSGTRDASDAEFMKNLADAHRGTFREVHR